MREPEFTPREAALLFASHGWDQTPKSGTGHTLEDATDPATQGKWTVPLPTRDFAQEALTKAQNVYKDQWPDADMTSLLWTVERG